MSVAIVNRLRHARDGGGWWREIECMRWIQDFALPLRLLLLLLNPKQKFQRLSSCSFYARSLEGMIDQEGSSKVPTI